LWRRLLLVALIPSEEHALSSERFLPRNIGSFTQPFDLDGTYRLKD
jgi:hypothetical protein